MIMHVDMDAYFATLEQQWNPALRGKPIVVCGKGSGERTVVATASYEAKRLGIKNGMAVWQAKKLCPQVILVPAQYQKYLKTTKKIIAILESFTPDVEVFSIDEAFLEIRNQNAECRNNSALGISHSDFETQALIQVALNIKTRISQEIGELCTCSIGIAPNKLLAKIASEFRKPDGLTIILDRSNPEVSRFVHSRGVYIKTPKEILAAIRLESIPGIGPRVLKRLNRMGIFEVKDLQVAVIHNSLFIIREFGPSYANFLKNAAFGIDNSPLVRFRDAPPEKSFGHSYTLPKEIYTLEKAKCVLLHLAEKVGVRMRAKKFLGRTVHVFLRFTDMSSWSMQTTVSTATDDGHKIYKAADQLIAKVYLEPQGLTRGLKPIRAVGISCSQLTKATQIQQLSLFLSYSRKNRINKVVDSINNKHGPWTIFRAEILPTLSVVENIPDGRNRRQFSMP